MNALTSTTGGEALKRWPLARLGDIAEHRLGKMLDKAKNTGIPRRYLGNPNVRWFEFDLTDLQEILVEENDVGRYELLPGDVLICEGGEAGRAAIWAGEPQGVIFQKALHRVRVGPRLDRRFLVHRLMYDYFNGGLNDYYTGATIKHFTGQDLARYQFPLPPLDEQRRVAVILDKADALRRKRKRALELLDGLTQSIFVEMFGDPAKNPKNWPRIVLGDCIHKASDGPHVSPQYSETGVPFLSTRHVQPGQIVWEDLKYIDLAQAEIHWKKCRPERGDILYTKGGTTGLAALIDSDAPFAVWVHVALLKTDKKVVDPVWLESMLNSEFCYRQSQMYTHGIANRDLGLKRMVKIDMYLPPKSEQERFVRASMKVRKLRATLARVGAEDEQLFSSLQHRAFTGQL